MCKNLVKTIGLCKGEWLKKIMIQDKVKGKTKMWWQTWTRLRTKALRHIKEQGDNKSQERMEKMDGDPNWKDCDDYSNPNIEVSFLERSGPSRVETGKKSPLDFFLLFLAC